MIHLMRKCNQQRPRSACAVVLFDQSFLFSAQKITPVSRSVPEQASLYMRSVMRKPIFRVYDQVCHIPSSNVTEDCERLETLD